MKSPKKMAGALVDQTVILVASEWIPDLDADPDADLDNPPPGHFLGSGFGILPFGPYSTEKVFNLIKEKAGAFAPIFKPDRLFQVKDWPSTCTTSGSFHRPAAFSVGATVRVPCINIERSRRELGGE